MTVMIGQNMGLNPCFSGNRFGSLGRGQGLRSSRIPVLILVLVEIGLGGPDPVC